MALTYVVDRIEGDTAALTDKANKRTRNVKLSELPKGVKAGTTVIDECGKWSIDTADTEDRASKIDAKMSSVFKH